MSKFMIILFVLFLSTFTVFAQTVSKTETKWERFAFEKQGFSVSLPKLPIVVGETNYDYDEETKRFGSYANGVAYVVSYSQEAKYNPFKEFQKVEPFTAQNFQTRLQKITAEFELRKEKVDETRSSLNDWQIVQLTSDETIYKLYFDPKTNNWIELWAIRPNDCKAESNSFFASLKIEKKPQGREVGEGARGTAKVFYPSKTENASSVISPSVNQNILPNDGPGKGAGNGIGNSSDKNAVSSNGSGKILTEKLQIVLKPRASYTEEARKNQIFGTVRMRVTFSITGVVTNISVMNSLSHGLTEQAISAASKILFVPEKRDHELVSVVKTVEYGFSLY